MLQCGRKALDMHKVPYLGEEVPFTCPAMCKKI